MGLEPELLDNWGSTFCIVAFSPDSSLLALAAEASEGPMLGAWDVSSAALLWSTGPNDAYCDLAFTADSRFLIADPEGNAAPAKGTAASRLVTARASILVRPAANLPRICASSPSVPT